MPFRATPPALTRAATTAGGLPERPRQSPGLSRSHSMAKKHASRHNHLVRQNTGVLLRQPDLASAKRLFGVEIFITWTSEARQAEGKRRGEAVRNRGIGLPIVHNLVLWATRLCTAGRG